MATLKVTNKGAGHKAFKIRGGWFTVASGDSATIENARELTDERIEALGRENVKVVQTIEDPATEAKAPTPDAAQITKVPAQDATSQTVGEGKGTPIKAATVALPVVPTAASLGAPTGGPPTPATTGTAPAYSLKEMAPGWWGITDASGVQVTKNFRQSEVSAFDKMSDADKATFVAANGKPAV